MPSLERHRLIAFDLPGFGLSDAFDYSGRPLRAHAVAQLTSLLDALGLERLPIVGTSLGGMWALCLALDAPERVAAVASLGVPAVAVPGMHGDPFFTALSTPGLRRLVARIRSPNVATTRRSGARASSALAPPSERPRVLRGRPRGDAPAQLSDGDAQPHVAGHAARPAPPENFLSDTELRQLAVPILMIWGDEDPHGGPEIGRRACELLPDARLEIIPGLMPRSSTTPSAAAP